MMLGNVAPQECCDIMRLGMAGDLEAARQIQNRVMATDWEILSRRAAGLKAALNLLGYRAGIPRLPTPACSPAEVRAIQSAMTQARLLS